MSNSVTPATGRIAAHLGLLLLLFLFDQLSKWWIESPSFEPFVLIDGWLNIIQAHNTGVAFSMFADLSDSYRTIFLLTMTLAIAAGLAWWWWQELAIGGLASWALLLVLAGATGNIVDRIRLGYVVDFIQCYIRLDDGEHYFPAFNVADSCITVGVILLLIAGFLQNNEEKSTTNPAAA